MALLPAGHFSVVVLSNVLEHLRGRPEFLRRLAQSAQPERILIRVPLYERDWRVPLKQELGVEWRLDRTHETEYTLESFAQEVDQAGLRTVHLEVRWGEIWAEVLPPTLAMTQSVRLALFLSRATPLAAWERAGIFTREVALYQNLRPSLDAFSIVTSGGRGELVFRDCLPDASILYNRWGVAPNLYSFIAPLLHGRALRRATVYKTNQLDGAWTAILAGILYRKPVVVRAGYLWADWLDEAGRYDIKARLGRRLQSFSLRRAAAIVVTTAEMKARITAEYGVVPARISVIPNFVNIALYRPMPEFAQTPGRICFVGRLEAQKNLATLFHAVARLSHVSLTVIGSGRQQSDLTKLARDLGIAVEFAGILPHHELPQAINRSEVFVLPSLYEGHPKALIEAMACGSAVVGTDVDGIRNVIAHESTGLLCSPTAESIAAALARLLQDIGLRQRLGQAARRYVENHYALDSVAAAELQLLRAVASA